MCLEEPRTVSERVLRLLPERERLPLPSEEEKMTASREVLTHGDCLLSLSILAQFIN